MNQITRRLCLLALLPLFAGCSTVYYGTMEKFGVHKRDILVDRVTDARDAQQDAKKQFANALEQFKSVVKVKGGELEKQYEKLNGAYKASEQRAQAVHDRIDAVENVADALFNEWRAELKQYGSESLRRQSQEQYDRTKQRYRQLLEAMNKAASRIDPVLKPMHDQVLFLKHNLNARAIAALGDELVSVQTNVDSLLRDMESAIAEADAFIRTMKE